MGISRWVLFEICIQFLSSAYLPKVLKLCPPNKNKNHIWAVCGRSACFRLLKVVYLCKLTKLGLHCVSYTTEFL